MDRLGILEQAFECELEYHLAKIDLTMSYTECFEHMSDLLEQQRIIQMIVDLMALRPKLNLNATHFTDSYKAEIQSIKLQTQIVKEVTQMQINKEFNSNNFIREYLEKTYRLVMD